MNSIARLQVIAFTCCVITTFLMVAATASTEWIKSEDWREGLFEQCVRAGAPMPMPFGGLPIPGCRRAHDAGMSNMIYWRLHALRTELGCMNLCMCKKNRKEGFKGPTAHALADLCSCLHTSAITTSDP